MTLKYLISTIYLGAEKIWSMYEVGTTCSETQASIEYYLVRSNRIATLSGQDTPRRSLMSLF